MAHVSGLFVYPIKSCRGTALPHLDITREGPRWDRVWMLVDAESRAATQSRYPSLAALNISLAGDELRVESPNLPSLFLSDHPKSNMTPFTARVGNDTVSVISHSPEADAWFSSYLKGAFRLVRLADHSPRVRQKSGYQESFQVALADSTPFLFASQTSLNDLCQRAGCSIPMDRFRANIIVDDLPPFDEDHWKHLRIGSVEFCAFFPCDRCGITTIDQHTGQRDKEPLKTLATFRRREGEVYFGVRAVHRGEGRIQMGDPVTITRE
jgi:uncharacterized protein YcbX